MWITLAMQSLYVETLNRKLKNLTVTDLQGSQRGYQGIPKSLYRNTNKKGKSTE